MADTSTENDDFVIDFSPEEAHDTASDVKLELTEIQNKMESSCWEKCISLYISVDNKVEEILLPILSKKIFEQFPNKWQVVDNIVVKNIVKKYILLGFSPIDRTVASVVLQFKNEQANGNKQLISYRKKYETIRRKIDRRFDRLIDDVYGGNLNVPLDVDVSVILEEMKLNKKERRTSGASSKTTSVPVTPARNVEIQPSTEGKKYFESEEEEDAVQNMYQFVDTKFLPDLVNPNKNLHDMNVPFRMCIVGYVNIFLFFYFIMIVIDLEAKEKLIC